MTAEGLRDATSQRLSDWTDARFGIGCFGLARPLLVITAACTVAVAITMRGDGRTPAFTVWEWASAAVGQLLASGYLVAAERRFARHDGPAVI